MQLKQGDSVVVLTGKDKGKSGKIVKVLTKSNKVIVEGVNIMKKHQKPSQANPDGGIVEFAAALDASNVAIQDPKTKQATRIGIKVVDGKKVRYSKKTGELLD